MARRVYIGDSLMYWSLKWMMFKTKEKRCVIAQEVLQNEKLRLSLETAPFHNKGKRFVRHFWLHFACVLYPVGFYIDPGIFKRFLHVPNCECVPPSLPSEHTRTLEINEINEGMKKPKSDGGRRDQCRSVEGWRRLMLVMSYNTHTHTHIVAQWHF